MDIVLNAVEARVLGSLMEKEATTPEYYPLSLNALINACNQKNNREPAMQLGEEDVRMALHRLQDQSLAGPARGVDSRVTKYEHRLQEVFNFTRGEAAVICVLLLRGPQTPGELRGRSERMHLFQEVEDVLSTLQKLMQREPALVAALPRQPGTKEIRYAHLLSGEPQVGAVTVARGSETAETADSERLLHLEAEVARLREEVEGVKAELVRLHGREPGQPSNI
ncbi:MAG TPA: YceH family protein [Acidobacteriaceae bacterium]|jgi:hypothetical protein|nr:YceH family protein [Acidobacteriaceae bacterium]